MSNTTGDDVTTNRIRADDRLAAGYYYIGDPSGNIYKLQDQVKPKSFDASMIHSWIILFSLLIAGLTWGLKLESSVSALSADLQKMDRTIGKLSTMIDNGIIPITQDRVGRLEKRIEDIEEVLLKSKKQ
jgi:hypothetical protein